MPQSNKLGTSQAAEVFCPGMYVRVPRDTKETPLAGEFRDFWLGQVLELDPTGDTAVVQFLAPLDEHRMKPLKECFPLDLLTRCAIAPQARFIERATKKWGQVLVPCDAQFTSGKLRKYFVEIGGAVTQIAENDLFVGYHDQAPDPAHQLCSYEFHHPLWQIRRDRLIERYAALQTATFGIEELVGARILLLSHQAEVIARVLGDLEVRYLLADEVGLGKTIEACVVLKGLTRREPKLKTLIVVPAGLVRQWYNELNSKFWIKFKRANAPTGDFDVGPPGVIVAHGDLAERDSLWRWLDRQSWDLLIVDEAHHATRDPLLYERLHALSNKSARCLLLSATPVERRATEYLSLLKLINPAHYDSLTSKAFDQMLAAQAKVRSTIAYLTKALNPDEFDPVEFEEEMARLVETLKHDSTLADLAGQVKPDAADGGLHAAREAIQYVAENYRLESRVIRNRRANLQVELPVRRLSIDYAYTPSPRENDTLASLHDYARGLLRNRADLPQNTVFCQQLFHAAFSSPGALIKLLNLGPAGDAGRRETVMRHAELWDQEAATVLEGEVQGMAPEDTADRLVRVMRAIREALVDPHVKVLVFSAWDLTLDRLYRALVKRYGKKAVAIFKLGMDPKELEVEVDRFQAEESCRILLSDESGGEGRNFQVATGIIHVDLPWSPSRIEQRIGRVDRLGRTGTVLSIVPFAQETLEHDLFRLWQDAFHMFESSISGLEIVLEDVQDQVTKAFTQSTSEGLANLLPKLVKEAADLRAQVEEERYFEQGAVNYRRRTEFEEISVKYSDGEALRVPLMRWADMMGLPHQYYPESHLAFFDPNDINREHVNNAKVAHAPTMAEALRRSRHPEDNQLQGTFDRLLAVRREDIVFFAPGEDWTDMILRHALQADRGACSAISRIVDGIDEEWHGFEFFYRLMVDPRPLFAEGYDPAQLLRAQGYHGATTRRLFVSAEGGLLNPSEPIVALIKQSTSGTITHMGQRGGGAPLLRFKRMYPPRKWRAIVERALSVATEGIQAELGLAQTLAKEAEADFALTVSGQHAANRWRYGNKTHEGAREIQDFERVSRALIRGIAKPLCQLESIRFVMLVPRPRHV